MLPKLLFIFIIASQALAGDKLLESLYGVNGLNKVTICLDKGVKCEGALWQLQWVVARGSCVAEIPLYNAGVLRNTNEETCEEYTAEWKKAHKVRLRFVHPLYNADRGPTSPYNLALLSLEKPYSSLDRLVNVGATHSMLWNVETWMNNSIQSHYVEQTKYINPYSRKTGVFASPVRMFLATVVLPSTSFIVFFLFVTFFTSPRSNRIPYKNLNYEKDPSTV